MPFDPNPLHPRAHEEKWISSASLLEASEHTHSPSSPPRTPEPKLRIPSFSLNTPGGRSPPTLYSTSSNGSPTNALTPLQFMRRAEVDPLVLPVTPSKASGS